MNKELKEIEKSLLMLYQKNMNFLKENFFNLYRDVDELSLKISMGISKEKYSLEMCNDYFDIIDLENGSYYYNTNSNIDAKNRADLVDFSNKGSLDLLRRAGTTNLLAKPIELSDVLPIVDFINKNVDLNNITFYNVMKFIYIGVGLGCHIEEIDKKIESYTTLIIEPELEIFRLSLFITDYSRFLAGNRKLFLNIGSNSNERVIAIKEFYDYHDYMNYNIKYCNLLSNLTYIQDEITDFFGTNFALSFPYKTVIENVKRTISFINNKDKFIVMNKLIKKDDLKNKKILLISAGPSLDNYISEIKEYQDRFIIVAVDVIVKKLEKNNIIPNIVFSIDPSHLCAGYLTTINPDYLKNTAIILLSQQHPETMNLLKERKLKYYFLQSSNIIEEIGFLGSAPNVGTFIMQTMLHFKANELYTIGNDAAFNQDTGARYASDSSYIQTENLSIDKLNNDLVSKEDIIEIKGNLQDLVKTNRSLLEFKHSYDMVIAYLKPHYKYKAFNLSNGVYIDGLTPLKKEEFLEKISLSPSINFDIVDYFDSVSKSLDTFKYEDDLKIINSIIQKAKKNQKQKFTTKDDFLGKKLDLMIWILEKSKLLSIRLYGEIFLQYSSIIDSYINFIINLKQNRLHTKENLEQINVYWSKGILSVFKDIKNAISQKN